MESPPQNTEFRIHPENFHPCMYAIGTQISRAGQTTPQFSHHVLQGVTLCTKSSTFQYRNDSMPKICSHLIVQLFFSCHMTSHMTSRSCLGRSVS